MQSMQPSTVDKLKMGAIMGSAAGLGIGFLFGGVAVLRYGPGPRGFLRTLGQYMLTSAATFGFFMSIGSVIRNEDIPLIQQSGSHWNQRLLNENANSSRIFALAMQQAKNSPRKSNEVAEC
ncbi:Protein mgr2 [Schizosaccharomyces pombe]